MKQRLRIILIIVLFTSLVLISPFITKDTVQSAEDLKNVTFGFPIPFVSQDLSHYDPPLPHDMSLASPWETPTFIDIGAFAFSLVIMNFIGVFLFTVLK